MERAAYLTQWKDKKFPVDPPGGRGRQGNAATRVQNYFVKDGLYAWGGHPDIDDLFIQQARELDPKRRETLLHQIQRWPTSASCRAAVGAGLPERHRLRGWRSPGSGSSPITRTRRPTRTSSSSNSGEPPDLLGFGGKRPQS